MKAISIPLLSLFLITIQVHATSLDKQISIKAENISFEELCSNIYKKSNVRIYYKASDFKKIKVTIDLTGTIRQVLEHSLKGSSFKIFEWEQCVYILPERVLFDQLPVYNKDILKTLDSGTEEKSMFKTGRQANTKQIIHIGSKKITSNKSLVKINGRILIEDNKTPAIGATVYVEELKIGSAADVDGSLYLYLKPGKYNVSIECLGYKKGLYFFNVYSNGSFTVNLEKSNVEIDEVVVYGNRQTSITLKDPGLEKLSSKAIKEIPMMMGERDFLKVSEMLPGIVSVGEGSAGLNVRGGNADQNAFYINGIPIYNTSHMFGFFPIFNSDVINDFTIYKGHIPAKFGGRLSSIFDIETRIGNQKKYGFKGGINPISANLTLEGPIIKDKLSLLINGRTTYSDWILSRIDDPTISSSEASFDDFTVSLDYKNKKSHANLFVYSSKDRFKLSDINTYEYKNLGYTLNYKHTFSDKLFGKLSLVGSNYEYETIDTHEPVQSYSHNYKIEHYEANLDFNHNLFFKNTFNYGLNAIYYKLDRGSLKPYGEESIRSENKLGKEYAYKFSAYLSDIYDVSHWLSLNLGVRYSLFMPTGPENVNIYNGGEPNDISNIVDTLNFSSNEAIKKYQGFDFRVAATFNTDKNGSIKLSFNQMQQNLFMLNNTVTVAPNTQWKLSDYYIKPARTNQYSFGVFRDIPRGNWETSVELFYKTSTNYLEFRDGADFLNSPAIETEVLQGDQKTYGIEFLLKRKNRKIDGWLSYTYSRSLIEVKGSEPWQNINEGEIYPSNYDIPHALSTVMNFHLNKRITLSTVFNYQKGRPITYPTSIYYIDDKPCIDYSKRNEYRIPDYFRADVSVTIEGNLKKNKLIHSSWMLSVYNVTGRNNPYSVYFTSEDGRINSYKYSVIGVSFVTVTWLFKRGNYDTE